MRYYILVFDIRFYLLPDPVKRWGTCRLGGGYTMYAGKASPIVIIRWLNQKGTLFFNDPRLYPD